MLFDKILKSFDGMVLSTFLDQILILLFFSQDDYSSTGFDVDGPRAFFANMPLSKTLTMNLDVPEPWLVEPVIAMYGSFL